ncbi:hypothetical protein MHBO_001696 [Bonamia ostreae]|uniref:PIR Superfamily Protein n=1 Tax=Bonamia ostreae TaxID=126728 RepID=A0ABV2AJV4_9EUKA
MERKEKANMKTTKEETILEIIEDTSDDPFNKKNLLLFTEYINEQCSPQYSNLKNCLEKYQGFGAIFCLKENAKLKLCESNMSIFQFLSNFNIFLSNFI